MTIFQGTKPEQAPDYPTLAISSSGCLLIERPFQMKHVARPPPSPNRAWATTPYNT
jgi:hypothetical protein